MHLFHKPSQLSHLWQYWLQRDLVEWHFLKRYFAYLFRETLHLGKMQGLFVFNKEIIKRNGFIYLKYLHTAKERDDDKSD